METSSSSRARRARRTGWLGCVRAGALALTLAAANAGRAQVPEPPSDAAGWRALFNGRDLGGWESYLGKPDVMWDVPGVDRDAATGRYLEAFGKNRDPLKVFTVVTVDGAPALRISGQGSGALTTEKAWENFHLRAQFKWGEATWSPRLGQARDSAVLYRVHSRAGVVRDLWPLALEFQLREGGETGDLVVLGAEATVAARARASGGGAAKWFYEPAGEPVGFDGGPPNGERCAAREDAEKPRGEWNTLELICVGGESVHVVNGRVVLRVRAARRFDGADGDVAPLTAGRIAFQSNGAEVFFRAVEVREIAAMPAEFRSGN